VRALGTRLPKPTQGHISAARRLQAARSTTGLAVRKSPRAGSHYVTMWHATAQSIVPLQW
jgi:hypothetical protein